MPWVNCDRCSKPVNRRSSDLKRSNRSFCSRDCFEQRELVDPEVRFWKKVALDSSGCWLWTGSLNGKGYGLFGIATNRSVGAHDWAYEHWRELVPKGLELDHLCKVVRCVNPWHLEAVTHAENMARTRRTHCQRGHELTDLNVYLYNGKRSCRACKLERSKQKYAARAS